MIMNKVCEYIREYLQLVYWFYFKQYTLRKWLKDIHPELGINTNPFSLGAEFTQNARLQHYASQVYRTNTVIVFLFLWIIPLIHSLFRHEPFNWINNGISCIIFCITYFGSVWLLQLYFDKWPRVFLISYSGIAIIVGISYFVFQNLSLDTIVQIFIFQPNTTSINLANCALGGFVMSMMLSTSTQIFTSCLIMNLSLSNILFFALDNTLTSITISVVIFTIFLERCVVIQLNSKRSMLIAPINILASIVVIILMGISVKANTMNIVVFFIGVASIFAMLRVYFWIPELIWMLGLQFLSNQNDKSYLLRRLPPYFDQLIILPLPFMAKIIIKSYRQNPVAARSTIDYFITSTNQQAVAKKAMFGIGIETLNQCRYVSDIIGSQIQLDWLPTDEKTFGKVVMF